MHSKICLFVFCPKHQKTTPIEIDSKDIEKIKTSYFDTELINYVIVSLQRHNLFVQWPELTFGAVSNFTNPSTAASDFCSRWKLYSRLFLKKLDHFKATYLPLGMGLYSCVFVHISICYFSRYISLFIWWPCDCAQCAPIGLINLTRQPLGSGVFLSRKCLYLYL